MDNGSTEGEYAMRPTNVLYVQYMEGKTHLFIIVYHAHPQVMVNMRGAMQREVDIVCGGTLIKKDMVNQKCPSSRFQGGEIWP